MLRGGGAAKIRVQLGASAAIPTSRPRDLATFPRAAAQHKQHAIAIDGSNSMHIKSASRHPSPNPRRTHPSNSRRRHPLLRHPRARPAAPRSRYACTCRPAPPHHTTTSALVTNERIHRHRARPRIPETPRRAVQGCEDLLATTVYGCCVVESCGVD